MLPFRLTYRMVSPIVLGEYPTTLDALVFAALCSRSGDEEWARAQLPGYFKMSGNVPHASSLVFGRTQTHGLVASAVPLISGLRSANDLSMDFIRPNGRGGRYSKVKTQGGPYQNRIDYHRGYWSPFVSFDFCGDQERLWALLDVFIIGIGAHAQIGVGQVVEPCFTPLAQDFSLIAEDGAVARPMPVTTWTDLSGKAPESVERGSPEPPYWRQTDCAMVYPERIRIYNH